MKLQDAFQIRRGEIISLVGAGGKTSTLFSLGHELAEDGWRVLATTTTSIGQDQLALMPHAVKPDVGARTVSSALSQHRFVFVYDDVRRGRVFGPPTEYIPWLLDSLDADVMIIEADSADGMPFKAPYDHEPVIAPETTLVIPVASLSALGQPLDDAHVYNARAMIERYGFYEGSPIKSPWIAQVLRDDELGLKGTPPKARAIGLLKGTPATGYLRGRARLIAQLALRSSGMYGVALGSVRGSDPIHEVQRTVGAVVLAAGMSTRMGQPKVLMPWANGRSILEHILDQLVLARIDPILVVTGHRAQEVSALAERAGVMTAHNRNYEHGEMLSSLKIGLQAMPPNVAGALLVLGDQPRIQPRIVGQVLTAYAEGKGEIIVPSYQMRRGHPILLDRRYWGELLALPETGSPRDVINAYPERIAYVVVDNDSVLHDVDTPQDYQRERQRAGLNPPE